MPTTATIAALLDPALPLARLEAFGDPKSFRHAPFVACVPARDEQGHVARCLAALDAELGPRDGVVLAANGCTDATVAIARAMIERWSRPVLLLDLDWRPGTGSAPLARRLAMELARRLAPAAILFSTDADTIVRPGLRQAYADEFASGHDLVCGAIGFIEEEARLLPPADPAADAVIRKYRTISARIAARLDPDPRNPWPHHGNIGGANFAIRGEAYDRVGGLPTPPSGEDRALRRACEALGLAIRYSQSPCVDTSCRLDGRAEGGLADELRRDRKEADPIVDEALEPADRLLLRLRSRRAFRDTRDGAARMRLLLELGLANADAARLGAEGGGLAWQAAEDVSPALARLRLRLSDLRRLLPGLAAALAAIEAAPSGSAAPRERRLP